MQKRPVSIRWKLVTYLSVLTAIILLITWFFQVYLLDSFYESTKRYELTEAADAISENIDQTDLRAIAYDYSVACTMRVLIYRLTDSGVQLILDVDATSGMADPPKTSNLTELFSRAQKNKNGIYFGKITVDGNEHRDAPFDFFSLQENENKKITAENTRLVGVKQTKNANGEQCFIVLNTALFPLDSTVRTLEVQFVWTAVILLIVAVITVLLLYRSISKPLIQMNESAKELAKGKYDAAFVGHGYLETHELADTLNYAATELSRVDKLQKELIANISHDLRTPLTMIKGYGELMRDIPGENTPENMQVVIDETERLSELVNDLLDLSLLQAGAAQLKCEPINLTDTVRECMARYDTLIRHRGYRLDFIADQSVWVNANKKMILQVLYNLMNNAINYTGADRLVTVRQAVENGQVRISVIDTGEGIAPEEMPLIWDRYYKIDRVHRRAMVGTGLGLSIVKGILEKHNADYGVSSIRGQGSTFWFELPILTVTETHLTTTEEQDS